MERTARSAATDASPPSFVCLCVSPTRTAIRSSPSGVGAAMDAANSVFFISRNQVGAHCVSVCQLALSPSGGDARGPGLRPV
jgi:hypothetical protein